MDARNEHSAGGIVFRHDRNGSTRVLAIKDSYGRWAFPKGRIEQGEDSVTTARRETLEEVGVNDLTLITEIGHTDFWFIDRWEVPGQKVHKTVQYFLFEAAPDELGTAHEEERVQRIHWVLPRELRGLISYKSLRPLVEKAIQEIERKTNNPKNNNANCAEI